MTLGALFLTSLAVGFSGAVSPGPLLLACLTRSARDGFRGGLFVTVGHAATELLAVVLLLAGLGEALALPGVGPAVRVVGGLVLIFMGYGTARAAVRGDMTLPGAEHTGTVGSERAAASGGPAGPVRGAGLAGAAVAGVAATVSGPYWIIWWATAGLSYLTLARPLGAAGVGAFYFGHISADFVWYAAIAAAVAGGRRLLSDKAYRVMLVLCGLLLLALGGFFAFLGASALAGIL